MSKRPPPQVAPAVELLLVSSDAASRHALHEVLSRELPLARITEVLSFSDAVMRLARGGMQLVVLDLAHLGNLSLATPLLLRGLAPAARLLAVGAAGLGGTPGLERVDDLSALLGWLQRNPLA